MGYIKALALIVLVCFLFGFAEYRHKARKISDVEVSFTGGENLYVTEEVVNKLLIQNESAGSSVDKEILDLNRVESLLNSHEMIENAEVFVTLDGKLEAIVSQRKPIGRVMGNTSFYLDRNGKVMPLSQNYSARVPLMLGFNEKTAPEAYSVANFIKNDLFLREHITSIHRLDNAKLEMSVRDRDFKLYFGDTSNVALKFNNFKAFYKKAQKDKKLDTYKKVNLQFGDQVVCTKK
ncbi:cell division protein FtsQ/DivIB [Christiangramia fulva]|nr:cell division protein FtsQ/DivIB [Christiangramia fulva]